MRLNRPDVLLNILEEHLEELDFLCQQRADVLFDPEWNLLDLAELEGRMEAHVDGLRAGEGHSAELSVTALGEASSVSLAAAAALALLHIAPQTRSLLVGMIGDLEGDGLLGLDAALHMVEINDLSDDLGAIASGGQTPLRRAVCTNALASHGIEAKGISLDELIGDADEDVCQVALAASARLGAPIDGRALEALLSSESVRLREAVLRAAAETRTPGLIELCQTSQCPEAIAFSGVLATADQLPSIEGRLADAELAPYALRSLGSLGTPAAVEILLQALGNEDLSREAGAAFTRITGADIAAADQPEMDEELEDEGGAELDEEAPVPDPVLAEDFWQKERDRFAEAPRWQAGAAITPESLPTIFNDLPLAVRRDEYLRLRHESAETRRIELEARARTQLAVRPVA